MYKRGNTILAHLKQDIDTNLEAFDEDLSVQRVAVAAKDPGLVEFFAAPPDLRTTPRSPQP